LLKGVNGLLQPMQSRYGNRVKLPLLWQLSYFCSCSPVHLKQMGAAGGEPGRRWAGGDLERLERLEGLGWAAV